MLHFVRPVLGYRLLNALPRSHELIDSLPNSLSQMTESHETLLINQLSFTKRPFAHYFLITAFCALLDLIGMFLDLAKLGSDQN